MSVAAHRRPGIIAFAWLFQLVCAVLISGPIVTALTGTGVFSHPDGDRLLFEPGGLILVETVRLGQTALAAGFKSSLTHWLICAYAALVPLSLMYAGLARPGTLRIGEGARLSIGLLPRFTLVAGITWVVRALIFGAFVVAHSGASTYLDARLSERSRDLILVGWWAIGGVLLLAVGVIQDLSRAAIVRHESSALASLSRGLRALRARPIRVAVHWAGPALWSLVLLAFAAAVVGRIDVFQSGGWRLPAVVLMHQLVLIAAQWLRAIWIGRALDLV